MPSLRDYQRWARKGTRTGHRRRPALAARHLRGFPVVNVTIIGQNGIPLMCEQGDAPASTIWTDTLGKQHYACQAHNPMSYTLMPLPLNFTSRSICHACGQPVSLGPQQVVYPGTAG